MFRDIFLTAKYIERGRKAHRTGHRAQGAETKRGRDRKTMYNVLQAMYYRRYAALEETARQCIMYYRRCIIGDVKTIGNYQ